MRGIGEPSKRIILGRFISFEEAKTFEEEIKYECWVVETITCRLDA